MIKRHIEVKNTLDGFIHCYPGAPIDVEFLSHPHRHTLFIVSTIAVFHDDRELEFYMVQDFINTVLCASSFPAASSCEKVATHIIEMLCKKYGKNRKMTVKVFEDNINGAIIEYMPD